MTRGRTLKSLNELVREGKRVQGRWELDSRHRLSYRRDGNEEALVFETSLVAAEPGALVLSLTEAQEGGRTVTSLARLRGHWRINDRHQIELAVSRASGVSDILTFRGAWKVGKHQEIIYTWRRAGSRSKTAQQQTLTFSGWWDFAEGRRLTYTLEGGSDASFRFRGAFQTPSILAKKGEIRYQLGVEVSGRRSGRSIVLFGRWKLSTRLALSFEMDYGRRRARELRFGAEWEIGKGLEASAQLLTRSGVPLGVEVIVTKDFLDGKAQGFARLKRSLEESAAEAGVTLAW